MTIQIKHPFVSAKGDGGDATLVRPSNWNAVHSTSIATGQLVGRLTAGVGAFEEIPISAYMAGLLGAADANALGGLLGLWTTGDVKYTFAAAVAPAGWISLSQAGSSNGLTIGNAASGGNIRAFSDTQALFVMLYTNCSDAIAPVSGGRTGNALNDFNANKTITIPQLGGRSPIAAGAIGTGTSARTLGQQYGAENYTILTANLPPYTPAGVNGTVTVTSTSSAVAQNNSSSTTGGGGFGFTYPTAQGAITSTGSGPAWTGSAQGGSSTPHNIIHPVTALNVMVKL